MVGELLFYQLDKVLIYSEFRLNRTFWKSIRATHIFSSVCSALGVGSTRLSVGPVARLARFEEYAWEQSHAKKGDLCNYCTKTKAVVSGEGAG